MAALIRQANTVTAGTNWPISQDKNERRMVEEKREKTKQRQQQTISEKKGEAGTVSEQRDKGWIHVIRVHDTTHLAVTTTLRGSRRSRDYPLTRTS